MLTVRDGGTVLRFGWDDLMRYHGPHSPGGVAHAYKVLELALPRLGDPPDRRSVVIRTAFGGPGARDGFELVTRAVTGGRYTVDPALALPELGWAAERFVFDVSGVRLHVQPGIVSDEFVRLARTEDRSAGQEARLAALKLEMAARLRALPADAVYAVR